MGRSYASASTVVASSGVPLDGKVYLVTGASNGVGLECTRALLGGGATVIMACRAGAKAEKAKADVENGAAPSAKAILLNLDLGDKDSVKDCANAFLNLGLPLHALINNAGCNGIPVWAQHTPGIETQFAVNFLGHFYLTELLHEKLANTPGSRVVNLASEAHRRITVWEPAPPPEETYDPLRAYAFSNLCRVLWTKAKAARLRVEGSPYPVVCLHPGVVGGTGMLQHMSPWLILRQVALAFQHELAGFLKGQNAQQVAACQTYLALAPPEELEAISGSYLNGNRNPRVPQPSCGWQELKPLGTPEEPSPLATSDEYAEEVFAFAQNYFGL